MFQICSGNESFDAVIDRIVARTCAVAPDIDAEACRRLVTLVFRSRLRQTDACGSHPECQPIGSVWPDAAPPLRGVTAEWQDLDPDGVPAMFAAAVADLSSGPRTLRAVLEARLAEEMRAVLRDLLYCNPKCGHAAICHARPRFPLDR